VTCGRLYGGVLLTAAGSQSWARRGLRVFASAPVVAVVSAALWCRDWRLALPAAALSALFLAASAAWRFSVVGGLCGVFVGVVGRRLALG
jgi:hypothetical protein